jgi:hypothetical protein
MDALHRAYVQSSQIAAIAVAVDAIDARAARFYRHFNFIPLPDRPDRLFASHENHRRAVRLNPARKIFRPNFLALAVLRCRGTSCNEKNCG